MFKKQKIEPGQVWTRKEDEFLRTSVLIRMVGHRRVVVQMTCHNGRPTNLEYSPEHEQDIRLLRQLYQYDPARSKFGFGK